MGKASLNLIRRLTIASDQLELRVCVTGCLLQGYYGHTPTDGCFATVSLIWPDRILQKVWCRTLTKCYVTTPTPPETHLPAYHVVIANAHTGVRF